MPTTLERTTGKGTSAPAGLAAHPPGPESACRTARTRDAGIALLTAGVVGVVAENVLHAGPIGAGMTAVFGLLLAGTLVLARRSGPLGWRRGVPFVLALLFAAALAWRASMVLTL